jgi:putative ABC transport system permease protein
MSRSFKHAVASLRADLGRTLAIVATFAVAFATVLVVSGFQRGVQQRLNAIFAAFMHPWEGGIGLLDDAPEAGRQRPDMLADRDRLRATLGAHGEFAAYGFADVDLSHLGRVQHVVATASDPELWDVRGWQLDAGRVLDREDDAASKRNCVVTETVARQLFGNASPLGQDLLINGTPFQIVGVRKDDDAAAGILKKYNQSVLIPLHTAMERKLIAGGPDNIKFRAIGVSSAELAWQIKDVLREAHGIVAGADPDFVIMSNNRMADTFRKGKQNVLFLGWAIAATATLLSGLMMANIMSLSVKHRKKEIGIRRAVGATRRQIIDMILMESGLLALAGCAAGAALAFAIGRYAAHASTLPNGLPKYPIAYTPGVVGISFLLLAVVSMTFAAMPARRAASIDPATAVR